MMPVGRNVHGRVVHVLAAYDPKEAQGRCVRTIADGIGAEHHLVCGHVLAGGDGFDGVVETGAGLTEFGWRDRDRLAAAVERIRPHVVHFHGGPLGAATLATGWTGDVPAVASIYAWTTVGRHSFGRGVAVRELRSTPVLATRSFANTAVPRSAIAGALRRGGVRVVTTPDAAVREAFADQAIPVGLFEGITPPRRRTTAPIPGHVVFAGRAEATRGPDVLLDAISLLRAGGYSVSARFCLLGRPDPELVARIEAAEGCTLSIGGADLEAETDLATAVVLPFRYDDTTLSPTLVATEAMAAGTPVIGGDVRCIRAAVEDRVTGLLVPPDDVAATARAIARLTDDPALAARLGAAAAAEIQRRWRRSNVVDLARWSYDLATSRELPAVATRRTDRSEPADRPHLAVARQETR